MKQRQESTVLFLCTGNYYRSRFAEVLFNSVAGKMGLPWRASSRGLALERGVNNVGPMEVSAVKALEARGLRAVAEFGRFPIQATVDPAKLPVDGRQRSPRVLRYLIETPLGPIAFYNVHPISPRHGLWALRTGGFKRGLLTGALINGETAKILQADGRLRDRQVEQFAADADKETVPVIIGGDTNLPGLSPALGYLSRFNDGFRAALGDGFVDYFVRLKEAEVARFMAEVTDWEQREYLELL